MESENSIDYVIKELKSVLIDGRKPDVYHMLETIDMTQDLRPLEEFVVEKKLIKSTQFHKRVNELRKIQKFQNDFGFDQPKTISEYINQMVKQKNGYVNPAKIFKMIPKVHLYGYEVTEEIKEAHNNIRFLSDAISSNNNDEIVFLSEIKTISLDYGLPFKSSDIDIAFTSWKNKAQHEVMIGVYSKLIFDKISKNKVEQDKSWNHMARAYFPDNELDEDFIIAAIKSFMWQVKRKASNQSIPLPTMLVITGAQESGKSTFVQHLIAHVKEAAGKTDFKTISNRKAYNLYSNLILYVEEMAGADKACIETIKDTITASTVPVNPLYTNTTIEVDQKATFIGNSNSPLGTIVSDSTGMRRYVEIIKNKRSNFEETNKVNWSELWNSVDDRENDPMDAFRNMLKDQQEENRDRTPIEMFFNSDEAKISELKKISEFYPSYRVYEEAYFPLHKYSLNRFSRTITNLIQAGTLPQWQLIKNPKGNTRAC